MNRASTHGFKAYELLKGVGIEIGALSKPFDLDATVIYADIAEPTTMEAQLRECEGRTYLNRKLVDIQLLLEAPFFNFRGIEPDTVDFCVSSNVVEHHPNPLYFLLEQLRVIKQNGILYVAIPNKEKTYDRGRVTTPVDLLEKRFLNFDFSLDFNLALDIVKNSIGHADYLNQGESMAKKIIEHPDGHHHFYTFDVNSTLSIINVLNKYQPCRLEFFNLDGTNIHFALRKR